MKSAGVPVGASVRRRSRRIVLVAPHRCRLFGLEPRPRTAGCGHLLLFMCASCFETCETHFALRNIQKSTNETNVVVVRKVGRLQKEKNKIVVATLVY